MNRNFWLVHCSQAFFEKAYPLNLWALKTSKINLELWEKVEKDDVLIFGLSKKEVIGYGSVISRQKKNSGQFKNFPLVINLDRIIKKRLSLSSEWREKIPTRGGINLINSFGEDIFNELTGKSLAKKVEPIKNKPEEIRPQNRVEEIKNKPEEIPLQNSVEKIRRDITSLSKKSKIKEALTHKGLEKYLSENDKRLYNKLIMLQARFSGFHQLHMAKTINDIDFLNHEHNILGTLLEILDDIE